jgi:PAS domain S-box-containing protein
LKSSIEPKIEDFFVSVYDHPRMQPPGSPYFRFGLSIVFVAIGVAISLGLQDLIPHGFLLFLLSAVMLAGWFGGTFAGLFAVALSSVSAAYFFLPPYRALAVELDEVPYFLSFLLSAVVASWLGATRRQVEARQQAHLDELFAQSPEAILLVDLEYRVLQVNKEFTNIFGYMLADFRSQSITDVMIPSALREEAIQHQKQLAEGENVSLETIRIRKGGSPVSVSQVSFPVIANGKCIAYYTIFRDITKSKQSLEKLQRAQAELAHLSRITTMGELASSIAHEVNQPIGAVATNADAAARWLTQTPPDLSSAQEALGCIAQDAKRAAKVIERIRSLLRKAPTPMAYLDLNEVIREVLALTAFETSRRGAVVSTSLTNPLPPVAGDRVQLHQVLLNLIMNSLDAMDGVNDRPRRLMIGSKINAEYVVIQVLDSGPGWKREDADRIFDPFFTTKRRGIGMGLTISRTIVENHGGMLWAGEATTEGAGMNIYLPVVKRRSESFER